MNCLIPLAEGSPLTVICPECRGETVLKADSAAAGAAALPSNYAIVSVIEAIERDKQQKVKSPPCGECVAELPSNWRCETCATNLCDDCCSDHHRRKATSTHSTVNLKTPSLKGPPSAKSAAPPSATPEATQRLCTTHKESLKIYCHDHKDVVCMCCHHILKLS